MRKFKLISTCASLVLMIALMAFGVYASKSVTLSIGGTITYHVSDVYIRVKYGLENGSNSGDLYTLEDPILGSTGTLPSSEFTEENDVLTYFVEVENLHSMDIHLRFSYSFETSSKYSNESVLVSVKTFEGTSSTGTSYTNSSTKNSLSDGITKYTNIGDTKDITFKEKTTLTLKISLSLQEDAKNYKLTKCPLKLKMYAGLETITDLMFNQD